MTQSDLENISMLEGIAAGAASIASLVIGIAFNIWWDIATSPAGVTPKHTIGDPLLKVLGVIVVTCVVVVIVSIMKRSSRLAYILSHSKTI